MRHLSIGLLLLSSFSSLAQAIDATDTAEIRQKAVRHVQEFERLLNLISQPEEYFRGFEFDELIRSYYQPGSSRQIFRDSLVVIEDDLNPTTRGTQYRNLLTIKNYLNTFFSLYEKSKRPGVSFTNHEVSPVQQDDFIYVEVLYDSKFLNRHPAFPDTPYPARPRKATVRAERQGLGWRVTLADISHYHPDADSTQIVRVPSVSQLSVSVFPVVLPIIVRSPPAEVPVPTRPMTEPGSYSFGDLRRVYRVGRTYALPTEELPASATLQLYRNDEPVANLSHVLTDNGRWSVSSELPQGDGYELYLSDSLTERTVTSPTFAVRRRVPWPIIAGAVGAAVVLVAIISGGDEGGGEEPTTDELPVPPDPE